MVGEWHDRFKERFEYLKRTEKLTQLDLAERLSVRQSTVWNWLNGRRAPRDLKDFERLAKAVRCDVDWLMYGNKQSTPKNKPVAMPIPILSPHNIKQWVESDNLPDNHDNYAFLRECEGSGKHFGFYATDSGMSPRVSPGDIIIIDPLKEPIIGSMIAVDFDGSYNLSVGVLKKIGPQLQLDMSKQSFKLNDDLEIYVGTVVSIIARP